MEEFQNFFCWILNENEYFHIGHWKEEQAGWEWGKVRVTEHVFMMFSTMLMLAKML